MKVRRLNTEQVKRFASDIGWGLISLVVTYLIGFFLTVILARWLGVTDLGLYQMVFTIQGVATLIAVFGIPGAIVKYVAEYKDDKELVSRTVSSGLITSVVLGILVGLLMYILSGALASAFHMPELARLLKILAFVFPFISFFENLRGVFNGLRKMKSYAFLLILRSLLIILFTIALVKLGFGVEGAVFSIVLGTVAACLVWLYPVRNFLRLNLGDYASNARKLLSFGGQVFGANALGLIVGQADILMIGYFRAATEVGYYTVASAFSSFLLLIPGAIALITYSAASEYWSTNNHQALQRMIDKSMKYSACIILPLGLGVGFFARDILTIIYGKEFIVAALPLCVLLTARVIRGGTIDAIGGCLSGIGRPDLALKTDAASAVANIILNILLIPRFGILGAAIGTAISLLLQTIIYLILVVKTMRVRLDIKWYVKTLGSAFIMVILFLGGTKLLTHYLVGGVILGVFVILIFKLFLTREDKAIFTSLTRSLIYRR